MFKLLGRAQDRKGFIQWILIILVFLFILVGICALAVFLYLKTLQRDYLGDVVKAIPGSQDVFLLDFPFENGRNELLEVLAELGSEERTVTRKFRTTEEITLFKEIEKLKQVGQIEGFGFVNYSRALQDPDQSVAYVAISTPFNLPISSSLFEDALKKNPDLDLISTYEHEGERYFLVSAQDYGEFYVWIKGRIMFFSPTEKAMVDVIKSYKSNVQPNSKMARWRLPALGDLEVRGAIFRSFSSVQVKADRNAMLFPESFLGLEVPDRIAFWVIGKSLPNALLFTFNHNLKFSKTILDYINNVSVDKYLFPPVASLKLKLNPDYVRELSSSPQISSLLSEQRIRDILGDLLANSQLHVAFSSVSSEQYFLTLKITIDPSYGSNLQNDLSYLLSYLNDNSILPLAEESCGTLNPKLLDLLDGTPLSCYTVANLGHLILEDNTGYKVINVFAYIGNMADLGGSGAVYQDTYPSEALYNVLMDENILPGLMVTFYLNEMTKLAKLGVKTLEDLEAIRKFQKVIERYGYKAVVLSITPDYQIAITMLKE